MRDNRRGIGDPLSERSEPAVEDARAEQGRNRADETKVSFFHPLSFNPSIFFSSSILQSSCGLFSSFICYFKSFSNENDMAEFVNFRAL